MAVLEDAIKKGMEALGEVPENVEVAPVPAAETGDTSTEEEEDTEEEETEDESEPDLDEEATQKAKDLYKALANPKTSGAALQFLYQALGYQPPETKAEVREQAKDIIEQMKEAAPGLEFLVEKIGPIIKQNLENLRTEMRQEVETDRVERANRELMSESAAAMTSVAKSYGYENNLIPTNILKEMTAMMNKVQPNPDLKPIEYIKMIHDASRAKLGVVNGKPKGVTPVQRLASERVSPTIDKSVPKKMSLNESIAAAVQQLSGQ